MKLTPFILLALSALLACSGSRRTAKGASAKTGYTAAETAANVERDVRYLASDSLRGRDTGSPEIERAAQYLAEQLAEAGVLTAPGMDGYLQPVALERRFPAEAATLELLGETYALNQSILPLNTVAASLDAPYVYVGYGSADELAAADLQGKIVIMNAGSEESSSPFDFFTMATDKMKAVRAGGGLALVELFRSPQVRWSDLVGFLGAERMGVAEEQDGVDAEIPLVWMGDGNSEVLKSILAGEVAQTKLDITPGRSEVVPGSNVVGYIPGTDTAVADEYIIMTAHYDHVGVNSDAGSVDSIFNGARDNALGTASLLQTAREFAARPARRPFVVLAVTGEEKGLLGSEYYVEHPVIPLAETVFNLNMDGAGYDDTTAVTVIGYGRTNAQAAIDSGAVAAGLVAKDDPAPEQGLFDRSDNANFARKGVPAVNLAPGMTSFSEEIMTYYHQPVDDAESLDFRYVAKYAAAIATAARGIANMSETPAWLPGDEYEGAREAAE